MLIRSWLQHHLLRHSRRSSMAAQHLLGMHLAHKLGAPRSLWGSLWVGKPVFAYVPLGPGNWPHRPTAIPRDSLEPQACGRVCSDNVPEQSGRSWRSQRRRTSCIQRSRPVCHLERGVMWPPVFIPRGPRNRRTPSDVTSEMLAYGLACFMDLESACRTYCSGPNSHRPVAVCEQ